MKLNGKSFGEPLRIGDVLGFFGLGAVIFGTILAVGYLGWANFLDVFLTFLFACTIVNVFLYTYSYIRYSGSGDSLGATLAVLMAISLSILIVLIMLLCFNFIPELGPR